MKIETKKHLYILFVIISLIITGIALFIIKQNILPYKFRLDKKTPRQKKALYYNNLVIVYNDLDNDGFSEEIRFNYTIAKTNNYIKIINTNGKLIKKFNLNSKTNYRWVIFEDYNNDNYKELFVFSILDDSLYLSIINIKAKQYILDHQVILSKSDFNEYDSQNVGILKDLGVRPIGFLNVDNDKAKELIFFIRGSHLINPRTIYSYDIEDKKIITKFSTGARLFEGELLDINNDGKKEIIVSANPHGNVNAQTTYDNRTGWLFVLNSTLTPIFTPKSFGSFAGGNYVTHFSKNDSNYFFILYTEDADSSKITKSLLLNSSGKELLHPSKLKLGFNRPLKVSEKGEDFIYIVNERQKLFKLNNKLEILKSNKISYQNVDFISEISIGYQNKKVLLARGKEKILLFNKELNLLATHSLDNNFWRVRFNFQKLNGKNALPQLPILTQNSNYLFTIVKSKIHSYLPLIILGLGLLSFLFLVGFYKILSFISTYLRYFGYSLTQSKNGLAILNSEGNLLFINKKLKELLKLSSTFRKGKSYKKIFSDNKDIADKISESILTKKNIKDNISYNFTDNIFKGEIIITPFTSFFGFTFAYLIQIIDYTEPVTSDRMKTWSSTIQRIAHEIKTPLSGINLGLDTLNNRLLKDTNKYSNDILQLQNEVERIRNLTKNFLLFSNLEKPNFVKINFCSLFDESLNVFQSYLNSGIELNVSFNDLLVFGDYGQLIQLFHIVIENSIDGCGGKGRIDVKCKYQNMIQNRNETEMKNTHIKITVSDNGNGIEERKLSKIFEPYYSTKKDGTGIGLAIAKKIVEDHNGKIEIESELGEGTTVYIYLQTI